MKIVRKPARKVHFARSSSGNKKMKDMEEKEKVLNRRIRDNESKMKEMAVAWKKLNEVSLEGMGLDDVRKIASTQIGFIRELLESHISSEEKLSGKNSEIDRLRKRENELIGEINNALDFIDKMKKS
jgi:phage shock protein A